MSKKEWLTVADNVQGWDEVGIADHGQGQTAIDQDEDVDHNPAICLRLGHHYRDCHCIRLIA